MKKAVSYIIQLAFLTAIWIVLIEDISLSTILFGVFFSVATLLFCYVSIGYRVIGFSFSHILIIIKYVIRLIGYMAVSAIDSAKHVILNKQDAGIYRYSLRTTSKIHRLVLANSVTLTPGTVAVSIEGDDMLILCIDINEYSKTGKNSLVKLENILLKG